MPGSLDSIGLLAVWENLGAGGGIVGEWDGELYLGAKFLSDLPSCSGYTEGVHIRSLGTAQPGGTLAGDQWEIKLER